MLVRNLVRKAHQGGRTGASGTSSAARPSADKAGSDPRLTSAAPILVPGRAVQVWFKEAAVGPILVAACAGCGARHEKRLSRILETVTELDAVQVADLVSSTDRDLAAFQRAHAPCPTALPSGLPSDRSSGWGVPSRIPHQLRGWADVAISLLLKITGRFSVTCAVLFRPEYGEDMNRIVFVPAPPAALAADQTAAWVRKHVDEMVAEETDGTGEVVALVASMCQATPGLPGGSGTTITGGIAVASEGGVFMARLGHGIPVSDELELEPRRLVWHPAVAPSSLFDGLVTYPAW